MESFLTSQQCVLMKRYKDIWNPLTELFFFTIFLWHWVLNLRIYMSTVMYQFNNTYIQISYQFSKVGKHSVAFYLQVVVREKKIRIEFTIILVAISCAFICLNTPYFIIWCLQFQNYNRGKTTSLDDPIQTERYVISRFLPPATVVAGR